MLTALDRKLLDELQYRFPLSPRPYRVVARRLGLEEEEVLSRLARLQRQGVLRYTGVTFDTQRLGLVSTLVALSVPEGQVEKAAAVINRYPGVSHNYLREGEYPLWFTLSAPSARRLKALLREIRRLTGATALLDLRTEKVFKARALFKMGEVK